MTEWPGRYRLCLDRIMVGAHLEVDGWAFHEQHGSCRVEILVDDRRQPGARARLGLQRHDVGIALGAPLASRSGFRLAVPLPAEAASVSLLLSADGEMGVLPILVRDGPSWWNWRVVAGPAPEAVTCGFLTERGPRFAAARPSGAGRLGRALALLGPSPLSAPPPRDPVSIVVPVYGGKPFLHTLARSLLEHTSPRHPVFLVDDGNADRSISAFLIALAAAHDHVSVVQMVRNAGYLHAVAAGAEQALRRNPQGHLVLLNTDVEVPAGWLERLVAPIEHNPAVASVTPLTNAGTICGFPMMPDDNAPFLEAPVGDIDAVLASVTAPATAVEVPTGVGFCMAMGNRALREIGFFDLDSFGRGYGEEVDWCRRALRRGFVNVAIANLYVHHRHGGSFAAAEKEASVRRSGAVISQRYPEFDAEVQDFIAADPLASVRAVAVLALWRRHGNEGPVLVFDHGEDGGAVVVRRREVARLLEAGRLVVLVRPAAGVLPDMPDAALDIDILHRDATFRFVANDLSDLEALVRAMPPGEVVVNSLVGFDRLPALLAFLRGLKADRGVVLRVLHNDYFPACPSLNLIDAEDRYCDLPPPDRCARCAPVNRHARLPGGEAGGAAGFDVAGHRRAWQDLFVLADRHVFFSRASLAVMRRAFHLPEGSVRVLPHLAEHVTVAPLSPPAPSPDGVLRVAIVGGINVAKGSRIVEGMVALAEAHRLPVIFELFGNIDRLPPSPHFHYNGGYEPERLGALLAERGCRVVFLPSIWPETHCYVFDEVIGLGLPVGVFAIGAPAERIRPWPNGFVVSAITAEAALAAILNVAGR